MILIISTCKDPLSELEFVQPLVNIVGKCIVKHYANVTQIDIDQADKIIISGTALKDFAYSQHDWSWLARTNKPVLGICAGMQVIAKAFGLQLVETIMIGPKKVIVVKENKLTAGSFDAYFLHTKTITQGFEILATTNGKPCMIKHPTKEIYGCIFHPEVLNETIIKNFC